MIVERKCKYCEKAFFTVRRPEIDGRGKFCSKKCAWAWRSENLRGENAPAWKGGGRVKRTCQQCGKEFETEMAWVRNGRGVFCSRKCHDLWRSENKTGKNSSLWSRVERICLECGAVFEAVPSQIKSGGGKFCSSGCFHAWRVKNVPLRGEDSPNWNGGLSYGKYCPKFKPVRPRVRAFFNYVCMMPDCECGNKPVLSGMKPQLDVHHVYYQKEACCYRTEEGEFVFDLGKWGKLVVEGNPTKFVTLCRAANGKVNKDRLDWAKYFENLINTEYGGKSYFTEEEFRNLKKELTPV